ncbi:hypothetical protein [Amycolatopsis sp.]|uniref:hypothetical protein n=1 Tax=Amycolatopsis sp. TaxID=37632 RepID=UPI002C5D7BD9|nr:hypothetical protein [Amycolatopsis sp.]HVV12464.1 hypothetical protein [Amycolatopsis sp.]
MRRHRTVALGWSVCAMLLISTACSAGSHVTPTANAPAAHPLPANGLCAYIDSQAAASFLTGTDGAAVLSTPAPPNEGQSARCQLTGLGAAPADVVDVAVSVAMQNGIDKFAELQGNSAYRKDNNNGVPRVWDAGSATMYARFKDTNIALTAPQQNVDSILTLVYRPDPLSGGLYTTDTIGSPLTKLALQIINGINGGSVLTQPPAAGQAEPMLTDDRGRPVENPILVWQVYEALAMNDLLTLSRFGGTAQRFWQATEMPYLNQEEIRAKIAQSMTVHPNCDDGCTYPGFVVSGWNTPTARADAAALGVDPTKFPDPVARSPVYASSFSSCMCAWEGTLAPKQ